MTLFSRDECPRCHTVRIVLAEKGINYDLQKVSDSEMPEDLHDLNPYGEVPTLVDRDLVLYNHQVIMEYLDERFPHPPVIFLRVPPAKYSITKYGRSSYSP